ncbi:hypothetical protein [Bdellovibrio bacteriovorus]|uniref:hypothetical protein n=1 Tax=Bdellovibrio bacteriovorus TaxID=959 RepID=UPI0035A5C880
MEKNIQIPVSYKALENLEHAVLTCPHDLKTEYIYEAAKRVVDEIKGELEAKVREYYKDAGLK